MSKVEFVRECLHSLVGPDNDLGMMVESGELVLEIASTTSERCIVNVTIEIDGEVLTRYGPYMLRENDTLRVGKIEIEIADGVAKVGAGTPTPPRTP